MTKTDFDKKLTSFNRKITSNKTKYLEVKKELNGLITNDYNFFLGKMYFRSNDESQNTFVYQPTLDTLELKKDKGFDYVLSWKSDGVYNSKLKCTLMQTKKSTYMFVFMIKHYPENFAFLNPKNFRVIYP